MYLAQYNLKLTDFFYIEVPVLRKMFIHVIYDFHACGKQEISPGLVFSETTEKRFSYLPKIKCLASAY